MSETSWGSVANWYKELLATDADSYQLKVIQPNLIRLLKPTAQDRILDLACGEGFFTRTFAASGASMVGVDISKELISLAREADSRSEYIVSNAEHLPMLKAGNFDLVYSVLAIQNIEHFSRVCLEVSRVLGESGRFAFVLNHPVLRNARETEWGFDAERGVQYRRLNSYMSETRTEIAMNPSQTNSPKTVSFHRPLQFYVKTLASAGFVVTRIEEWISHKESQSGPRKLAEDRARKEFPMFMYIEAQKR